MSANGRRILAILWAVATAMLPGVLSVTHAREAAAMTVASAHVEAEGGSSACPPAHGDACVVCSTLRIGPGAPPSVVPFVGEGAVGSATPHTGIRAPVAEGILRSSRPRAPPAR